MSTKVIIADLPELLSVAVQLGARTVGTWSADENSLALNLPVAPMAVVDACRHEIVQGGDPLGELFCHIHSAEERRPLGAVYTPDVIVRRMLSWTGDAYSPARVVDPGAGSGRFLVAAGKKFPSANLVGVEIDPAAAIIARANIACAGLTGRTDFLLADFRDLKMPIIKGSTLYAGNPPYVRHHLIERKWKHWLIDTAKKHGLKASQLSGLHVHFFLAIADAAKNGDVGVLITAAEWLDVNYGRLVRELLLGDLGCKAIQIIEPKADAFPGTATTAVITALEIGTQPKNINIQRLSTLDDIGMSILASSVSRTQYEACQRWSALSRRTVVRREGYIQLGEICRVHRGQVTGKNRVWIEGIHSALLPDSVLFSSVTRARELFAVDGTLADAAALKRVIDIPADLDTLSPSDRVQIERFLELAKSLGADVGYVAQNRKAWWSVGLRKPAPILATYMARRPPAFVRNVVSARHINIAHGLYPIEPLTELALINLAHYLSSMVTTDEGRTYAGGLTKFEPSEMERLVVPGPEILAVQGGALIN